MRITITGGAGYVGSVMVPHLLIQGMRVTVFDSLRYGGEGLLPYIRHPRFRFVKGDVRDADALDEAFGRTHCVIHLAALVGDRACDANQHEAMDVNTGGTVAVVDAAKRAGVTKLLFASTASCYGRNTGGAAADEDAPLNPLTLYAKTKVAAERIVINASDERMTAVVLRFATSFGLSPRMRFDLILNQFAAEAVGAGRLEVYEPQAWRSHAHVSDIARAVGRFAVTLQDVGGQIFNVGGFNRRKRDLVRALEGLATFDVEYARVSEDNRDYRVNFGKVERFGFEPLVTPEDGIAEIVGALQAGWFCNPQCKRYGNW